jgi:hypothetical protein
MRSKKVKIALLAIALSAAGASSATAITANAATTPASTAVHAAPQSVPKIPSASVRYVVFFYSTGGIAGRCLNWNEGAIAPPEFVQNGCLTRVWLYQNSNETGYDLCLRPNSTTGHLGRAYRSFRVVPNNRTC